jgi:hypothetical protein
MGFGPCSSLSARPRSTRMLRVRVPVKNTPDRSISERHHDLGAAEGARDVPGMHREGHDRVAVRLPSRLKGFSHYLIAQGRYIGFSGRQRLQGAATKDNGMIRPGSRTISAKPSDAVASAALLASTGTGLAVGFHTLIACTELKKGATPRPSGPSTWTMESS